MRSPNGYRVFYVTYSRYGAPSNNAGLLVRALSFATGRVGKLRHVLVTAVAYLMSTKFRTGLTLAMFALVIFTLMVMSVLTESVSASVSGDLETVVGGWDIESDVNFNTPIEDMGCY